MYKYLVLNHIPRCGGTSLRKSIYEGIQNNKYFQKELCYISQYTHSNMCLYDTPELGANINPKTLLFVDHSITFFIEEYFKLKEKETYRALTIRNPLSRVVSHIHFFHGVHVDNLSEEKLNEYLLRYGNITVGYLTAQRYKDKPMRERLEIAKSAIKDYQFLFKLEDNKSYELFNKTNPFELKISNTHINQSKLDYNFSQKTKNIIYSKIKFDIDLLSAYYDIEL